VQVVEEPSGGQPDNHGRYQLADWEVDIATNRLRRGGTEVKVESRVMAVLGYLAQHPGELVTREELERAVWGSTVVGYDALTRCIARLRKLLGDDLRQPRYIETIAKKGYRLVAPVTAAPAESGADATSVLPAAAGSAWFRAPWWRVAVLLVAVPALAAVVWLWRSGTGPEPQTQLAGRPSIVVLPFTHLGDDPEQAYFSDGITADITTALSKLSGLFVISQSSARNFQGRSRDLRQVARSLGVRYVLEGSVRRSGDRLRVTAGLVDADSNTYLWSEKYDRELRAVFDLQDDITRNIVSALSVRLTEAERRRSARRYTVSIDAYEDFLRGQALYSHRTEQDNRLAREHFEHATARDPAFARAWGAMALTFVAEHRFGWNRSTPDPLERALELARRAVALDSELPQAYFVLGYVHVFRRDYDRARQAASRAIELDPNFADSYLTLAVCRMYFGEAQQALPLVRKAMQLNPGYPASYISVLGQIHYLMGQYQLALPLLREAAERNVYLLTPQVFLVAALGKLGRIEDARWAADQLRAVAPGFRPDGLGDMLPVGDPAVVADMQEQLRRAGL
jgi:TolB-like protein/DNA-binding winged helix-turn-helix (wHTH) protein/Tfp pilus assembly protein PilF